MMLTTRRTSKRLSHLGELFEDDSGIAEVANRAQAGDERAFTQIHQRYFGQVYGYLRVALRDAQLAEEASRRVFLKVAGLIPGYERGDQPFSRWLFGIARNEALDRLRESDRGGNEFASEGRWRDSVRTDGLRALLRTSDHELMILMEDLPEAQRRAAMLRYVLGWKDSEIAEVLDADPASVRDLQRRALRTLDRRLASSKY
jgi:RNA polymerase sigma-70 factor, ECF subfamily